MLTCDWSAVVLRHLHETEPDAVKGRRVRRFQRRRFHAAGVNDVWAQDQHDKWGPRFGLWLHNNIDPFTGYNNWLKIWWTNKNPRLIAGYYIETVRAYGGELVTLKSFNLAFIQKSCSYSLDDTERPWIRKLWCRKHSYPCPSRPRSDTYRNFATSLEANKEQRQIWSQLVSLPPGFCTRIRGSIWVRCQSRMVRCWQTSWEVSGFQAIGIFTTFWCNPKLSLIFRWLAIPWIQSELDKWVLHRNRTRPRYDSKKILPNGIPLVIRDKPEKFDAMDFKVGFIHCKSVSIYLLIWIGRHLGWTNWPSWGWVCPTWSWGFPVNTSCISRAHCPTLRSTWTAFGVI